MTQALHTYLQPMPDHMTHYARMININRPLKARPRVNTVKLTHTQKDDVHMKNTVKIYVSFDTCFNIKPNRP